MVLPIDILRSAQVCITHYGDEAEAHALERIQALKAKGDAEGVEAWTKIANAIRSMQGGSETQH